MSDMSATERATGNAGSEKHLNTQLVDSLVQVILSLPTAERTLLEEKLIQTPYPSLIEIQQLAQISEVFADLAQEPDLYSLEDGEPIQWH